MVKHTVARSKAVHIYFYHDEGMRPHLHVKHKDGTEAQIWIDDLEFKKRSKDTQFNSIAKKLAEQYQEEGNDLWNEVFKGDD